MRRRAPSTTGVWLYSHAACEQHVIRGHPEQPARVPGIITALLESERVAFARHVVDAPRASDEQLSRFHTAAHVRRTLKLFRKAKKKKSMERIDGDTCVMPSTGEAALRAAGAACAAVDAVLSGRATSAFCAIRPPGHHATPSTSMGFCFLGNAGVAALHARAAFGIRRVAVLDWDVHHGNGTQAGVEDDADLFFGSSHQYPCYPGTGAASETGVDNNVVNCELRPESGSAEFRAAWSNVILPAARDFEPELIIVSAGFDAHADDPLAEVNLTDEDYGWVQREIMQLAAATCGGRVVSVLEGGYDLDAIARCAVECVAAQVDAAAALSSSSSSSSNCGGSTSVVVTAEEQHESEWARARGRGGEGASAAIASGEIADRLHVATQLFASKLISAEDLAKVQQRLEERFAGGSSTTRKVATEEAKVEVGEEEEEEEERLSVDSLESCSTDDDAESDYFARVAGNAAERGAK